MNPSDRVTRSVHVVVPEGIDDPIRPSGGNVYDRRTIQGLTAAGWQVVEVATTPWTLARDLAPIPDGSVAVVDGLVAAADPDLVRAEAGRLRVVPLVHMPFGGPGEAALLAACPAVLTTSHWTRRWLVEEYSLSPEAVHVAEPGVDMADPAAGSKDGGALVCVAALTPGKGHDLLLDALAALAGLPWHCSLVGSLDLDPPFVDGLRRRVLDTGIADRVSFLGALGHEEVAKAYAEADLLVLASRGESYGMVVTEALARALPVVATAVGGVPAALSRGDDGRVPGILVAPEDVDALAAALRRWLEEPAVRARLRRAAGRRRLTLSSWSTTAARVADVVTAVRDEVAS